jgi:hypothetical protein
LNDILSQIPSLKDHADYKALIDRIPLLEQQLGEARAELLNFSRSPQPTVEPDGDLDAAVGDHVKAVERHTKQRTRAELKVSVIEHALAKEQEKLPQLRQQAEDFVGAVAAKLHQNVVAQLLELKEQMSNALTLERSIRYKLQLEVNKQTLGHGPHQISPRYCPPPNIGVPVCAQDHVIPQLVREATSRTHV